MCLLVVGCVNVCCLFFAFGCEVMCENSKVATCASVDNELKSKEQS